MENYEISIEVKDQEGNLVCTGRATGFESAEQELGKLERYLINKEVEEQCKIWHSVILRV